jgi:hypothetical protein
MTDPREEDNLEQLYPQPTCGSEECQVLYIKYKVTYDKYYRNLQRVHMLTHENQLLSSEIKHKVALLELEKEQLGLMLEQEKKVSDILQHNIDVSVDNINGGLYPVCAGCVNHRAALIQHRTNNSENYNNVRRIHEENTRIMESCKKEVQTERLINGKLRMQMGKSIDPFWKDQEVLQLRRGLSQYKEMYEESKCKADSLKAELGKCKERLLISKLNCNMLENELIKSRMASKDESVAADSEDQGQMVGTKRKLAEESDESEAQARENGKGKKPLMAMMNTILEHRFGLVFCIDSEHGCEHEENFLYDIFRQSIDSDDLERCFESVYKACHPEESFSLRDRKLLKEGLVRVCKGPFGACLKALGGESKKRGTQIIWTNVKIRKA